MELGSPWASPGIFWAEVFLPIMSVFTGLCCQVYELQNKIHYRFYISTVPFFPTYSPSEGFLVTVGLNACAPESCPLSGGLGCPFLKDSRVPNCSSGHSTPGDGWVALRGFSNRFKWLCWGRGYKEAEGVSEEDWYFRGKTTEGLSSI